MGTRLVASGGIWDLGSLSQYEDSFAEGDRGILDLELRYAPPSIAVQALEDAIRAAGVTLTRSLEVISGSTRLRIHFKKEIAPLLVLAIAVGAAIVIFAILISWKLYQVDPALFSWQLVLVIAMVITAFIVVIVLVARKGKVAAGPVVIGK